MSYSSSEGKAERLLEPSVIPRLQRLSLRSVKIIIVFLLLAIVLVFFLFWQPAYLQLKALQAEETYWQQVLRTDGTKTKDINVVTIPTMDQLPDIIEQCRGAFVIEGVDVVSLNVERFGERRDTSNGASLDYGLVRLHLRGSWEDIVASLKALEETQGGNIYLQEVVLGPEGGETLLQIYFSMGQ